VRLMVTDSSRRTRALAACICVLGTTGFAALGSATGAAARHVAHAAKRVNFVEVAHLTYAGEHGKTVIEHGNATGTYKAPLTAEVVFHAKYVSATVTIRPAGGTITGSATANFRTVGATDYFGGTFTLGHCTGKFRHASEINKQPLGISGSINRNNFRGEVKTNGAANL
jgi:hypothetical protein